MPTTIYYIRHGESAANAGARTSDEHSIALTEKGWEQARGVRDQLLGKASHLVASPYRRARDTAAPLSEASHLEIHTSPIEEFLYLDPVQCANTSQDERGEVRQHYWGLLDPAWRHSPRTESFSDLLWRVENCLREMKSLPDGAALFGHGLFGMALLVSLHFPAENQRQQMERLHRLVYREGRNLRNGQILAFSRANGRWLTLPPIPS
jgi:2,3-bisphosphoglycerate-dependent phosphoglycerate mutase